MLQDGAFDGSVVGPARIKPEQLTDDVWNYIFIGVDYDSNKMPVGQKVLDELRREFLYWLVLFSFCWQLLILGILLT